MKNVTFPSLETAGLFLRIYDYGDEEQIVQLIADNRDYLRDVLSEWAYTIKTVEQASLFIKKVKAGAMLNTVFAVGIWSKVQNCLLGEIILFRCDWVNRQLEIGCYLSKTAQGKGVILEALHALIDFVFAKMAIDRIIAVCVPNNFATLRINRILGFVNESSDDEKMTFSLYKASWLKKGDALRKDTTQIKI